MTRPYSDDLRERRTASVVGGRSVGDGAGAWSERCESGEVVAAVMDDGKCGGAPDGRKQERSRRGERRRPEANSRPDASRPWSSNSAIIARGRAAVRADRAMPARHSKRCSPSSSHGRRLREAGNEEVSGAA